MTIISKWQELREVEASVEEVLHGVVVVHLYAGQTMVLVRVTLGTEEDIGLLERPGQHHGLLVVDVVVSGAMDEQEVLVLEVLRQLRDVRALVGLQVVLGGRQAHVALGVHRVVIYPGGDGRDGDAAAEDVLGVPRDGRRGHVAAVGPAPDGRAVAVDRWERIL